MTELTVTSHPGRILNATLAIEDRLTPLDTPIASVQPYAVVKGASFFYTAVPYGEPRQRIQTHRKLTDGTFKKQPSPSADVFLRCVEGDLKLLASLSDETLALSAADLAQQSNSHGWFLLNLNHALLRLLGYRRGVVINIVRDGFAVTPPGSEGAGR